MLSVSVPSCSQFRPQCFCLTVSLFTIIYTVVNASAFDLMNGLLLLGNNVVCMTSDSLPTIISQICEVTLHNRGFSLRDTRPSRHVTRRFETGPSQRYDYHNAF